MSPWTADALGNLATIERTTLQPEDIRAGTVYVGLEHITSAGDFSGVRPIAAGVLASSKFQFTERHVLYGKLRPYLAKIACPEFSGICSTDILPILPGPRIDRRYLFHYLRQPVTVRYASSRAVGINLPRLSPAVLANLQIPVPSLREQRRIADILDRADELRVKRRTATTLIGSVSDALFVEMFCGRESHYWQETPVAALAADVPNAIRTGPFGSQLLHSEFVDSGIAVLGIDNAVQNTFVWGRPRFITERKYRQLQRYTVRPGDVLVTIMGTCGRCAVVPEDIPTAINTKHLCCITLNTGRCLPVYLQACFLKHPRVLHQLGVRQRGAVMPGLNMQLISQLRIPEAPMPLQREFARLVSALETVEEGNRASDKNLNTLFASLQHGAFRGEL